MTLCAYVCVSFVHTVIIYILVLNTVAGLE